MLGIHHEVKPIAGKGGSTLFLWKVVDFGHAVAEGVAETEKEAVEAAKEALFARIATRRQKAVDKGALRTKLRELVHQRPYLVAGVVELLILGRDKGGILLEAREVEEHWWGRETPEDRKPIPSKEPAEKRRGAPLKPAPVRAAQLLELLERLDYLPVKDGLYVVTRVSKWAEGLFGPGWLERGTEHGAPGKKGGRR